MAKKKWAQKVKIREGALGDIGWPSAEKITASVSTGRVKYATAIRRLQYLANVTNDPDTKRRARSIIVRLQDAHEAKS